MILLNSFPANVAYMRQWTGSALVQVMAGSGQAITWTNAGLLSIGILGTNLNHDETSPARISH